MRALFYVLLAVSMVVTPPRIHAQDIELIPFTARQGLSTARDFANAPNQQPSIMVSIFATNTGTAPIWMYHFPSSQEEPFISVVQPIEGQYFAERLTSDTSDYPIYVQGQLLPSEWIDSDSAMSFFRENSIYEQWMHEYGNQRHPWESFLMAGYTRANSPLAPEGTPLWIYYTVDSLRMSQLVCWCGLDGSMPLCWSGPVQGGFPFTAKQGLTMAQITAQTVDQPCLVASDNADTSGRAYTWYYIFPNQPRTGNINVIQVRSTSPDTYEGDTHMLSSRDTLDSPYPAYILSSSLPEEWIDSDVALALMRFHPVFQQWMRRNMYSVAQLLGGRLNQQGTDLTGQPMGAPFWYFTTQGSIINDSTVEVLICWCTMERQDQPNVGCAVSRINVSSVGFTNESLSVVLSPNPAHQVVFITSSFPVDDIHIYSMIGTSMPITYTSHGVATALDISSLASGSYIVEIRSSGRRSYHLLHVIH